MITRSELRRKFESSRSIDYDDVHDVRALDDIVESTYQWIHSPFVKLVPKSLHDGPRRLLEDVNINNVELKKAIAHVVMNRTVLVIGGDALLVVAAIAKQLCLKNNKYPHLIDMSNLITPEADRIPPKSVLLIDKDCEPTDGRIFSEAQIMGLERIRAHIGPTIIFGSERNGSDLLGLVKKWTRPQMTLMTSVSSWIPPATDDVFV